MEDASQKPTIAAFDFDGTLTYRDTLLPFILFLHPIGLAALKGITLIPHAVAFACGIMSRQRAKEGLITRFLAGRSHEELKKHGETYAKKRLPDLLRPEGLKRLDWHKSQGHRCILISASLDTYLQPWAQAAGFDDLLCSQLEVNGDGTVTGRLKGLNCWGPEKTRRLNALLGTKEKYNLYAYGDSRGDQELLALADHAFYRKMPI